MKMPAHRHFALSILLLAVLLPARALAVDSLLVNERKVTELAPGVYTIRHVDPFPGWVNGNTTVIIGDREVLVVDACQFSFVAQEDIAQIRQWTSKPVRWLVNTHWHQDHNANNNQYMREFPGLAIVSHPATREMIAETSLYFLQVTLSQAGSLRDKLTKRLETGKTDDGQPLTDEKREQAKKRLEQLERIVASTKDFSLQLPTVTFERQMTIDLGGREARVMHLGRGNTAGDVVVYLPKEKILMSGDLLVSPVPFTFDGYPAEWIETLEKLDRLDADVIVPGHGAVMHDKSYLHLVAEMMRSVVAQVQEQLRLDHDASLDKVKKAVDLNPWVEKFSGGDKNIAEFFNYGIGDKFVELVFNEAKQR